MKIRIVILISLFSIAALAQDNIGLKYFGLTIHPNGEKANANLMPYRFDKHAYFVLNLGAAAMYEKFLWSDIISAKVIQGVYADCAVRWGGFSHLGVRVKIFKRPRHSFYCGLGPTFIYRKNWASFPGYINSNRLKGGPDDKYQYVFIWFGGEIEYKYVINDKFDLGVSMIPGYPVMINFSFGLNYKFRNSTEK